MELEKLLKTPRETQRLILRPWKHNKSDARECYRYAKDHRVGPAAGWPVHKDPADSLRIIGEVLSTPGLWAMVLKETGKPVGTVGLTFGSTGRKWLGTAEVELGYWLGVPYWGQGLAREASEEMLRLAFGEMGMDTVWAAYYEENQRSKYLQERLGFVYSHCEEETYVEALHEKRREHFMKLTKERWKERIDQRLGGAG
ncbi:MAG: GNAT family N-acetyltransferase [Lachnospiraceae bacterium]|nr:GNAT family N-acetyltransferase [Lachnospiraceae bacterium]